MNKELKDYTDEELTNEITKRIDNYSLSITSLLIPLVKAGMQYYQWYQEKQEQTMVTKKFKYNYLTNQLWKLIEKYNYEVSEENHFRHLFSKYGKEAWQLANNTWLFITLSTTNLQVVYQENELIYQQTLALSPEREATFEFTDQDLINYEKN